MRYPLWLILAVALPCAGYAESDNYGSGANTNVALSDRTTNALIRHMKRDFKSCFRLDKPYRYDCYDHAYDKAAARLAGNPAYSVAQQVMADVGRDIKAIVERNLDPAKPALKRGGKTFRPIEESALPQAKAEVIRSIEEAQTVLLRSRDTGDHFSRISAALESNKVLLRSALLMLGRALRLV